VGAAGGRHSRSGGLKGSTTPPGSGQGARFRRAPVAAWDLTRLPRGGDDLEATDLAESQGLANTAAPGDRGRLWGRPLQIEALQKGLRVPLSSPSSSSRHRMLVFSTQTPTPWSAQGGARTDGSPPLHQPSTSSRRRRLPRRGSLPLVLSQCSGRSGGRHCGPSFEDRPPAVATRHVGVGRGVIESPPLSAISTLLESPPHRADLEQGRVFERFYLTLP